MSSSFLAPGGVSLAQHVAQHQRVIAPRVARRVEERQALLPGALAQSLEHRRLSAELRAIAPDELRPAPGALVEPLTQLRARREVAEPAIERSAPPADSTRTHRLDGPPRAVR